MWGQNATNVVIGNYGSGALIFSGVENLYNGNTLNITTNAVNGTTFNLQTLSGVLVSGSLGNSIVKNGPGTLLLSGNNQGTLNLTGAQAITINNGTLQIGTATVTGDASLGVAPTTFVSNNIVLNGGVLSWVSGVNETLNASRGIYLQQTGAIDGAGNDQTIASVISGAAGAGLIKTGNSNLILAAGNTYTGPTVIASNDWFGIVAANSGALGPVSGGGVTVLGGGSLTIDNTGQGQVSGTVP